jgi:autotransporter translocation and assembly factor TamB
MLGVLSHEAVLILCGPDYVAAVPSVGWLAVWGLSLATFTVLGFPSALAKATGAQVLTVRNFEIEGLDTRAKVTGHANLMDRTLNFDADADTDLAILEPLIPNAHPDGKINTRIALRGTLDKPDFDGFIKISGGELGIDRPDILLREVDAEAQLRGNRIEITHATGLFNGGRFEATGGTGIAAAGLQDAAFRFSVERGQLDYPEGLQSEFSSQLAVDGSMPTLTVTGSIDVLNAIYQKNFSLAQQLFARITSQAPGVGAATATISDQIRMEVEVRTPGPITVKNNVADLEAMGSFRIRGTVANPIILGRADVQDGGELYFGPALNTQTLETTRRNDRYTIERGSIDFNNPLQTEPNLDFLATHELNVEDDHYLIRLEVTGTPTTLKAELTSDPYLPQSDIVTMLLTGRKLEELQGTYASVAGEQALGYVSGQLSERAQIPSAG